MPTAQRYRRYWIWPVLDEDGKLDYWDIHHPDDSRGEGDPEAQGLSTLADARAWVTQRTRDEAWIGAIDHIFQQIAGKR